MIDFEKDADTVELAAPATLEKISQLAERQADLEEQLADKEKELEELKKELRKVAEEELPNAMGSVGMDEFKLKNGAKVSVKKIYAGSIKEENRSEAFKWLRDNGYSSLVSKTVGIGLGTGEVQDFDALIEDVSGFMDTLLGDELECTITKSEKIHPATLSAFVKEQVEAGQPLPSTLFGVYIGNKTKITLPKEK